MFIKLIKQWFELLLSIFFARQCAGCRQIAEAGLFCAVCRTALVQPLWLTGQEALDGVAVLFRYDGPLKKALQQIKFAKQKKLLELLTVECSAAACGLPAELAAVLASQQTLLLAIPTARQRIMERGFDIPLFLFENFAGKRLTAELLLRTRATLPQYALNPQERKFNLENCFTVSGNVAGKTIVVADDIFTTGATMEEAARTLKAAGAVQVYGLALCGSIENYGGAQMKKHLLSLN